MKAVKLIILSLTMLSMASCSTEIQRAIMKNFEQKPTKEFFKVFHFVHEKEYELNSEEGIKRYKNFKANIKIIKETNAKNLSYTLGVNKFADMTVEEFKQKFLQNPEAKKKDMMNTIRNLREEGFFDKFADEDDEKLFDHNEERATVGAFTPIDWTSSFGSPRDQGACGSCWTFAATGVLESYRNRKNANIGSYLSTQQLVDCDTSNNGCNGGDFYYAFTYIKNNGIVDESSYKYKAAVGTCSIPSTAARTKISRFSFCSNYWSYTTYQCTEDKSYATLTKGPSAVGIDGSAIMFYESGIFSDACSEDNHAVIMVGYGIENGVEFYKIRNSWSSSWGENGYIRIARNKSNVNSCYVTNESYTVTLA